MKLDRYQIDAFTDTMFMGNPACIVPLKEWLPKEIMLKIARENAVAETAFFIDAGDTVQLRWFTPEIEMDLCGHATLATAHCLISMLGYAKDEMVFETRSGKLKVNVQNDMYYMELPSRPVSISELPEVLQRGLGTPPKEIYKARDYLLVYDTVQEIADMPVNRNLFDQINLDPGGVIITAKGNDCDFVSRFFTPQASIFEDAVTGSAHCSLIPFWAKRLGKRKLTARQISERGGELYCQNRANTVVIGGKAKTYSVGHFWTE